ncbi:FMN-linked oxidoreductase [Desarmillaria tabescens]|uniref:FMN-linked oxidoreductase n=1 Tax=Armillaria tabescens TaxID=1929756 RepID=A0AA39TQK2_ARMTA|nr:FMN-linked oxidoreductase [Desarmillaria tabescens]KAK0460574.1 FMN-linked oxidoreductase [Desarmillaria tabescens]
MSNLKALFQPLKLGPTTLRNRILMSALTQNRSVPTNVPNSLNAEYYRQRAEGGAGLIITEGVLVSQQGTEWQNAPGIWSQEQVNGWKKVTDTVHKEGGMIFTQLWHHDHPDAPEQIASGLPIYAPSAISAQGGKFRFLPGEPGYVTPTAIDDPRTLLAQWKQAAINMKQAEFDGVEIHGANRYLIHQFLDSTANHRTEQWGRSVENRARFPLEVVKIAVDVWGADRVDTFRYLISEIDRLGIAYVTLRATKHDVLGTYAPLLKNPATKVFANASFTGEEVARYVEDGKVDGVFFGIPWVANPDLAKRFEKGVALEGNIDFMTLYGHGGMEADERKGYADYPAVAL